MGKRNLTVGSVLKSKDGKSTYIQIRKDLKTPVTLQPGMFLNLASKQSQLDHASEKLESGAWDQEYYDKQVARINKIPDFVKFEVSVSIDVESEE